MSVVDSIFNCQNCGKKLWLKYYKLPNGRAVCPKCFDLFIRTGEIEKIKENEKLNEKKKKYAEFNYLNYIH